jgi:hypothetical protein
MSDLNDPKHWTARAEEMRVLAHMRCSDYCREAMWREAEMCEQTARMLEQSLATKAKDELKPAA